MTTTNTVDLEAARAEILDADRAFSEAAANVEGFTSFFAPDARLLAPDGPQADGVAAIGEAYSELSSLPGFSLSWQANYAEVASSGDLGYSVGTFVMNMDGPDGSPITRTGKYGTVWKKQDDGQWKVIMDAPNFDSPAA